MVRQQVAIRLTGILTPTVRMVPQPCCGPPTSQRHLERLRDQSRIDALRMAHPTTLRE
jgi:hypothetical protein